MEHEPRFAGLRRFFVAIWPATYRIINASVYFVLKLIKGMVTMAANQLR